MDFLIKTVVLSKDQSIPLVKKRKKGELVWLKT